MITRLLTIKSILIGVFCVVFVDGYRLRAYDIESPKKEALALVLDESQIDGQHEGKEVIYLDKEAIAQSDKPIIIQTSRGTVWIFNERSLQNERVFFALFGMFGGGFIATIPLRIQRTNSILSLLNSRAYAVRVLGLLRSMVFN